MNEEYIIKNPKIEKLEKIEEWYDKELRKIKFNKNQEEDADLMAVHVENLSSEKQIEKYLSSFSQLNLKSS